MFYLNLFASYLPVFPASTYTSSFAISQKGLTSNEGVEKKGFPRGLTLNEGVEKKCS